MTDKVVIVNDDDKTDEIKEELEEKIEETEEKIEELKEENEEAHEEIHEEIDEVKEEGENKWAELSQMMMTLTDKVNILSDRLEEIMSLKTMTEELTPQNSSQDMTEVAETITPEIPTEALSETKTEAPNESEGESLEAVEVVETSRLRREVIKL